MKLIIAFLTFNKINIFFFNVKISHQTSTKLTNKTLVNSLYKIFLKIPTFFSEFFTVNPQFSFLLNWNDIIFRKFININTHLQYSIYIKKKWIYKKSTHPEKSHNSFNHSCKIHSLRTSSHTQIMEFVRMNKNARNFNFFFIQNNTQFSACYGA